MTQHPKVAVDLLAAEMRTLLKQQKNNRLTVEQRSSLARQYLAKEKILKSLQATLAQDTKNFEEAKRTHVAEGKKRAAQKSYIKKRDNLRDIRKQHGR
jgi:hypothetical protein